MKGKSKAKNIFIDEEADESDAGSLADLSVFFRSTCTGLPLIRPHSIPDEPSTQVSDEDDSNLHGLPASPEEEGTNAKRCAAENDNAGTCEEDNDSVVMSRHYQDTALYPLFENLPHLPLVQFLISVRLSDMTIFRPEHYATLFLFKMTLRMFCTENRLSVCANWSLNLSSGVCSHSI